ncbi:MAG: molybdenum ABC transporter permease [Planctomycetota bacterium]|nr:MAG: molybdenum ABC transporter permease [Planctomycetota bacterium]
MLSLCGIYIFLLIGMVLADFRFIDIKSIKNFFNDPNIISSLKLSIASCSITTVLCLWVAIPIGYILSRYEFRGKSILDSILDIPIMLPPLVIGICLLFFFSSPFVKYFEEIFINIFKGSFIANWFGWEPQYWTFNPAFTKLSVIIAQFMVACAFAVRIMKSTFDEMNPRKEEVALTLGCSKGQSFWLVALPNAKRGIITAATLAWARSLGEFGPILIFAGTTRMKTEVLSTSVYLEFSVGNIAMATTISMAMIMTAIFINIIMRQFGGIKLSHD